jgi:gliding motility-associated lipoprotein GldH
MKQAITILVAAIFLCGCDDSRFYEKNYDFENRVWMVTHKPSFEFNIDDTTQQYNIYCNVRSSLTFPFARLFLKYYVTDSLGKVEREKLVSADIFDRKTGEPQGASGLGDIYDHRFMILKNHSFDHAGKYKILLEQFNRKDTLDGILAVGVRIEKIEREK